MKRYLENEIKNFKSVSEPKNIGNVLEVSDGIATVSGLSEIMSMEVVEFESGVKGVALNLEEDQVGIMVLGDYKKIRSGEVVIPALMGLEKKKKIKEVEEESAPFEAQQENKIRKALEENPEFATHCYECIHFNPDLLHCSKKLSKKISYQRIKEITINGKTYCLYHENSHEDTKTRRKKTSVRP